MIDKGTSLKIRVISVFAMLSVVAWHSECGSRVERWFIPWVTTWSVPWFFCVSGFFFVKSAEKVDTLPLLRKKISTLLVPYIIWCVLGWGLWRPSLSGWRGELLGLSSSIFPRGNWPLWYVRALLIFMSAGLFAYMLRRFLRPLWAFFAFFVSCIVLARYLLIRSGIGVSPFSSTVFFLAGSGLALWDVDLKGGGDTRWYSSFVCSVSLIGAFLLKWFFGRDHVLSNIAIALVIIAIWHLYDHIKTHLECVAILGLVPGIYFMHGPLIKAFDLHIGIKLASNMNVIQLDVFYFCKALVFFLLSGALCYSLKRFLPRFAAVAFGGR